MKPQKQTIVFIVCAALASAVVQALPAKDKEKNAKPLAGYSALMVAPFTTEKSETTKNFPQGEEKMLKKNLLAELLAQKTFDEVIEQEASDTSPSETAAPSAGDKRRLVLTGTVVSYSKGSSTARFLMWPIPVAPSVVKVRFVFRDADSGQEIFRTEQQGKYNALGSLGVADKQESLAGTKGGLIRALLKEISKRK